VSAAGGVGVEGRRAVYGEEKLVSGLGGVCLDVVVLLVAGLRKRWSQRYQVFGVSKKWTEYMDCKAAAKGRGVSSEATK
jgi:hypothetical protein